MKSSGKDEMLERQILQNTESTNTQTQNTHKVKQIVGQCTLRRITIVARCHTFKKWSYWL
jgi:hypothetical protein